MPRRWAVALAILVTVVGLACKRPTSSDPSPTPRPPRGDLPSSMVALGDSLTAAYGSCLAPVSCPRNSWSTGNGTQVRSHYRRILEHHPAIKGHGRNVSVPGARAEDLPAQARAAVASPVEYVTIQIGSNDACRDDIDMTGVAAFRTEVDRALSIIKQGQPEARLLVVSIPDVYRVWEVGRSSKFAVGVWDHEVCQSLLARPGSTAAADVARRKAFRDRIIAYNRELAAACSAYGPRCRWDGGATFAERFELVDLSALDFFHPNAAGQNALAEVSFPTRFGW
jgi:lysophospholipase L1-like esterase